MLIGLLHIFLELLFVVCVYVHTHTCTYIQTHMLLLPSLCAVVLLMRIHEREFSSIISSWKSCTAPNLLCIFLILRLLLCHCFLVGIIWDGWRLRKGLWTYLWGGFLMTHQLGPVMWISRCTWESMFGSLVKFSNEMKTVSWGESEVDKGESMLGQDVRADVRAYF